MRMSKRIAATALAAAMALSMLTACGGGGGGSTGGNSTPASKPNNPSSSASSSENGGTGNTGNTGTSGGSAGTTSAWASTKTYQYNQMLRGSKLYMDTNYRITDSDGTWTTKYIYTQNGAKSYTEITDDDGETVAVYLDGNWAYLIPEEGAIVEGEKIAAKMSSDDLQQQEIAEEMALIKELTRTMLTPDQPDKVEKATKNLNGKPYDAEIYQKTIDKEKGTVTCYYLNKVLKYIVYDSNLEHVSITVNGMSATAKEDLMKVPAGYYIVDEDGNVYDENGKLLYSGAKTAAEFFE